MNNPCGDCTYYNENTPPLYCDFEGGNLRCNVLYKKIKEEENKWLK